MKRTLPLNGIHCASCVSNVEKILNEVNGISDHSVNLALKTVTIDFTSTSDLENAKFKLKKNGYDLITDFNSNLSNHHEKEVLKLKKKLIFSLIFGIPLFFIAMTEMIGISLPITKSVSNILQLILTIIIMLICFDYYKIGFYKLFKLKPDMNSLIALGTSSAFCFSLFSILNQMFSFGIEGYNHIYFESAGIILLFITVGKYIEENAKGKASQALKSLLDQAPKIALVKRDNKWKEIPINDIIINDIIRIKPGEKIPVDGLILEGLSHIDESIITGESIPIKKEVGHHVISPSMNTSGTLLMKAEKVGAETLFSQIIRIVEEAQSSKAPIQSLADKISAVFVPIVLFLAFGSFIYWTLIFESFQFAINIFVSVLIIACPCSLGLATPTALVVGLGIGAKKGIHFKNATSIQNLSSINSIVFDKTGTITSGEITVTDIITSQDEELFKSYFKSIEFLSEHLLAKSIVKSFSKSKILKINDFKIAEGLGVSGILNNRVLIAGSKRFMNKKNIKINKSNEDDDLKFQSQGKTVMHLAYDGLWLGMIAVADKIRDESDFLIYKLKKYKIDLLLLSGDNQYTTKYVSEQIGVSNYKSEMLPIDKINHIRKLKSEGKIVAMVGDGINDAPSLVEADVGITLSTGTEIAAESSDVVLMKPDLRGIITSYKLSKLTLRKIKQNLFWAFLYNILLIPIAMGVLYPYNGFLLNPMIAGGAMALSSISVIFNSLSLKFIAPNSFLK
ncbi:MAG: heavy metal translocating P-type ATPase [Candidatus Neomarinimicrobiota bacterium]|nr:heavy metal translocating P-type ATPase [Candidatus Neomarinimicrobiota bacterium]